MQSGLKKSFTLIEALLSAAILGFTAVGITSALMAGINQNKVSGEYTVAVNLGQALIDEILSHPFYDPNNPLNITPGPEADETSRIRLDNIDDYDGLSEPEGAMKDPNGFTISDQSLKDYSRSVTTQYVYLPGQDTGKRPTFIIVTVEVKCKGMKMVELKRLISSAERTELP